MESHLQGNRESENLRRLHPPKEARRARSQEYQAARMLPMTAPLTDAEFHLLDELLMSEDAPEDTMDA